MTETPIEAQWLPLADAATHMHVSIDTLRRRVKRGDVTARQVPRAGGYTWEVCLPIPESDGAVPMAGMAELVALLDRLTRENRELAGRTGYLQAELLAAQEQLLLLKAPVPAPLAAVPEPAPVVRRRWWHLFR